MTPRRRTLPEAMSIQMVAAILDVTPITIRRWIRGGYIAAYRIGPKLVRIPRSEVSRMRQVRIEYPPDGCRTQYPKV